MMFDPDDLSEEEIAIFSLSTSEDPHYKKRVRCHECGKRETLHWNALTNHQLHKARLCFDCMFWIDKINADRAVRVNHEHYMLGEEDATGYFRGFGGRSFRIYFFDGRVVESNNLWCQGEIPEHFWDRLPDNARLIADDIEWDELMKQYGKENGA